jgi:glycosyltransferase involved in cell wall biosynthesis
MRVLAITNLYPNPYQPHRAPFNRQQLRALAGQHEVRVTAPIAWTDEAALRRAAGKRLGAGRRLICDGMVVDHPRYLFPPKVMRGWHGHCFRASVRARFRAALEEFGPDVVYASWAYPDGWAAVDLAREARLPVAVKVHGSDVLLLGAQGARRRRTIEALERADAVVAVSRHLAERVVELGVDARRVSVVYNGINKELFNAGGMGHDPGGVLDTCGGQLRMPSGGKNASTQACEMADKNVCPTGDGAPLVLFVGNLLPVKGPDVLVDACDRLMRRGLRFNCRLIGQGGMRGAIERQIDELGLADRVKLLGARPLEELPSWYRRASVLVLPSYSEGVPNVVLEALACGTPVVASRVGGVPEIASAESLVAAGDAAGLALAIERVLAHGGEARAAKFEPPSWEESAAALGRVLEGLTRGSDRLARDAGGARLAA